jgi:hypothetical protein
VKVELREHGKKGQRCPFCHDDLGASETWTCPGCSTVHHLECAREGGKCAELGCGATLSEGPAATAPRAVRRWRRLFSVEFQRAFWLVAAVVFFTLAAPSYAPLPAIVLAALYLPIAVLAVMRLLGRRR